MANKLNVTELDFDQIKSSLKSFLAAQTEFSDYDFEGSGLSVLLDVLAYNTHYNAYYLNMIANESFLDTAMLRNSVVSHAKQFSYIPRSISASSAFIKVTVADSSNTALLTVPAGYQFIPELIDNRTYPFTTIETYTANKANNKFVFDNVRIYEGTYVSYSYVYNKSANPNRIFVLTDENIDTSTLSVTVKQSAANTDYTVWNSAESLVNIDSTSSVYFLQEGQNNKYEIYFGDGYIGKTLPDGAIVTAQYLITNGTTGNGAKDFIATENIGGLYAITIDTVTAASGGASRETTESIKFNAPLQLLSQNRAVTKNDYIKLINQRYPHFDAVNVWGGEDNSPPVYGRVFISAKPKLGFEITDTEKEYIKNKILKPISIMTVVPEFVDPEYVYLKLDVELFVDKSKTSLSVTDIEETVRQYVISWADSNLNKFDDYFNYSSLESGVSSVDKSILSNEVEIMIGKKFRPDLNVSQSYQLDYGSELTRGTSADNFFTSTSFTMIDEDDISRQCYFEEVPSSYTGIESITVTNPGFNYTSTPTIEIVGDGSGAVGIANIVNGKLESITVTNPGIGYTSSIVRIIGGGGQSAEAFAVLEGRYGQLRIVYYKADATTNQNTKFILNSGLNDGVIGIIDYFLGKISISQFNPIDVNNDFKDIRIFFRPKSNILRAIGNKIFVLDVNDATSITLETSIK